ncbi:hypothetical protein [Limnobacter sp.]|uniref:hypothetical protein n=1 Tax=Limnobacter sp. TaxID=2003368 RepID=UPI002FE209AE
MQTFQQRLLTQGLVATLVVWSGGVLSQQTIANPLVRPAMLQGTPAASGSESAEASQRQAATGDAAELRRQAERRITQEDLNIRQQALNSPVLPVPLINLFANMQVTAYFQGAIVMRRVENDFTPQQVSQPVAVQQSGNSRGETPTAVVVPRPVSRSSGALRLRVGKTENVSGYPLRAMVNGQDITVDWRSENGTWVNVFYGALESSAGGLPQVPSDSQLLKVETNQFDHLVPVLRTQTFSPSGALGGQQGGNFGSGFGGGNGGFGGNQGGNNQPGFGTGFPN